MRESQQEIFTFYHGSSVFVDLIRMEDSPTNYMFTPDLMFVSYKGEEYRLKWDDHDGAYVGFIEDKEGYV